MSSKRAQEGKRIIDCVKRAFDFNDELLKSDDKEQPLHVKQFAIDYTKELLKKRIPASIQFCKDINTKYQPKYPNVDVAERVALMCSVAPITPKVANNLFNTDIAFAIWVLDILREYDKLDELCDLLPEDYGFSGKSVYDISYDNDLIERLAYVANNNTGETSECFDNILNLIPTDEIDKVKNYYLNEFDKLMNVFLSNETIASQKRTEYESENYDLDQLRDKNIFDEGTLYDIKNSIERFQSQIDTLSMRETMASVELYKCGSLTHQEAQKSFSFFLNDTIEFFDLKNPYAICAAYYIYQHENSNIYWSYGISLSLFVMAAIRLPWNGSLDTRMGIKSRENVDIDAYKMCYRLDDIDEAKDKGFLINKSQLIYHLTGGAVLPRKLHQFDDIKLILEKQNINKSEIDDIINLSNILNEVSHRRSLFDIDFSDDETDIDNDNNDENEDIEEAVDDNELNDIDVSNVNEKLQTLSAAVKQIKDEYLTKQLELTHQIQQLERQVKRLQAEKNAIQEKTENEHQELVDLRNLVFNSQDEEAEKEEKYDSPIEFPYSVKHNISVFGGHETWRKSIKTMFNNVRFISKDIKPNQDIIKNSNIIWIQANAMSHSYYYAVIDIARANNVSVRYFSYASARKCAEQIVMNDLKN